MGYVGNAPAEKYTTIDKQTLTGNNTVGPYTLTHSVGNEQEIEVFVNNVRQEPGVSYTVSSNQLTMSASVASADDFYVIFQGKAKMTATHPPTFDLTAANGTFTGTVTTGGLTVGSDTAKTKFYSNSTYNGIYNGSALTNNESIYMGSGTLFFYSGGGERMRIDSSGNVGIAIAPQSFAKLQVKTSTDRNVAVFDNAAGTTIGGITDAGSSASLRIAGQNLIFTGNGGSGAEHMRIDSSGRVGIGTSSPSETLHVEESTTGNAVRVSRGGNYIVMGGSGSGTQYVKGYEGTIAFGNAFAGNTTFLTGDTERMRIDSSGRVGIGTSSPDFKAEIVGGTNDGLHIKDAESATVFGGLFTQSANLALVARSNHALTLGTNDTERLRIDNLGRVLIGGTNTAPGFGNTATGLNLSNDGRFFASVTSESHSLNRNSTDGDILQFRKDGTHVGTIGVINGQATFGTGDTGFVTDAGSDAIYPWHVGTNASRDNAINLGAAAVRWKDLYLSGGVNFGTTGGSVTGKTLDDYEEGSWTPFISGSSTTGTGTYSSQIGRYVKIGKQVSCWGQIVSSSTHTGTGTLQISGFPFTKENTYLAWGTETSIAYFFGFSSYGTSTDTIRLLGPVSNGTFARFHSFNNRGDTSAPPAPGNFVSGASMYFAATYEVQ